MKLITAALSILICILSNPLSAAQVADPAERLFQESSLIMEAVRDNAETYGEAFAGFEKARANIEKILIDYSSSDIATAIENNQIRLMGLDLDTIRWKIGNSLFSLSSAEKDPFTLSLLVAWTIKDEKVQGRVVGAIALKCARAGRFDLAEKALKSIDIPKEKDGFTTSVAVIYAGFGDYDSAVMLTESIVDEEEKSRALAEIAGVCIEKGDWERAYELLQEALNIAEENDDQVAFGLIAKKYVDIEDLPKALEIVDSRLSEDRQTSVLIEVVDKYLDVSSKKKNEQLINGVLNRLQSGGFEPFYGDDLAETAAAYSSAGETKLALEFLELALDAAGKMEHFWAKPKTMVRIACLYNEIGDTKKADLIVNQMLEEVRVISFDYWKNQAHADFALHYAVEDKFEEAFKELEKIIDDAVMSPALEEIALILGEAGDTKSLSRVLNEANGIGIDRSRSSALAAVALAYFSAGNNKKADEVFRLAMDAAGAMEDDSGKAGEFVRIADKYRKAQKKQEAFLALQNAYEVAITIGNKYVKPRAMGNIVTGYCEAGAFTRALEIARKIEDWQTRDISARKVVSHCQENGFCDEALQFINGIDTVYSRSSLKAEIVKSYLDAGDCTNALEVAKTIIIAYERDTSLEDCASASAGEGDFVNAFKIAGIIEDIGTKSSAIADIAAIYERSGDNEKEVAIAVLREFIQTMFPLEFFWIQAKRL